MRRRNKQRVKTPKKNVRKHGRHMFKQDGEKDRNELRHEMEEGRSIALVADENAIHECLMRGQFRKAGKIILDDNIDSEENKERMAQYQGRDGSTPAQVAILNDAPYYLVEKIIQIGGKEAVTKTNKDGYNAIHTAAKCGSCPELVDTLCEFGGKDALYQESSNGELPVHKLVMKRGASIECVRIVLSVGGRDMLDHKNQYGRLPVHNCFYFFNNNLEVCKLLVKEGHHHGVGGEGSVGGLFTEYTDNGHQRTNLYKTLHKIQLIAPVVKGVANEVSDKHGTVPAECTLKHGHKWETGAKDFVEATSDERIKEGLVIYAAAGKKCDLTAIFELSRTYAVHLFG